MCTNEQTATPDISLPLDGALAGRCARPRTQVHRCSKNAQIVAISRTPITPYKLPNWIHMSFRRNEISSDSASPRNQEAWCDYPPRLSHDDFRPMFTYLIHPPLLGRADLRRPGPSSNPRDGMTLDDANDAGKHARCVISSSSLRNVARHHHGRVVSIARIPTVAQENLHPRDPMADEVFGPDRHPRQFATRPSLIASLMLPRPCRIVSHRVATFGQNGVCVWSSPSLGMFMPPDCRDKPSQRVPTRTNALQPGGLRPLQKFGASVCLRV